VRNPLHESAATTGTSTRPDVSNWSLCVWSLCGDGRWCGDGRLRPSAERSSAWFVRRPAA